MSTEQPPESDFRFVLGQMAGKMDMLMSMMVTHHKDTNDTLKSHDERLSVLEKGWVKVIGIAAGAGGVIAIAAQLLDHLK